LFYLGNDDRIMVVDYIAKGDSFIPGKPRQWSDKPIFRVGLNVPSFDSNMAAEAYAAECTTSIFSGRRNFQKPQSKIAALIHESYHPKTRRSSTSVSMRSSF
jgi:hypothetical protein